MKVINSEECITKHKPLTNAGFFLLGDEEGLIQVVKNLLIHIPEMFTPQYSPPPKFSFSPQQRLIPPTKYQFSCDHLTNFTFT